MGDINLLAILLLLVIVGILMHFLEVWTRKLLQVEQRKFFSHKHVTDHHKKLDWGIRIIIIIFMLIGAFINGVREPVDRLIWLEPFVLLIILIFITEILRAYMEWKHEENRNAYKATIIQLILIAIILIVLFSTNFLGILP